MFDLQYLGHASWLIKSRDLKILCDPWFNPNGAFLSTWFPFPKNNHLFTDALFDDLDFIYISHAHEDHFDKWTLRQARKNIPVLIPKFEDKTLYDGLNKLKFQHIRELSRDDEIIIKNTKIKIIEDEGFFDNDSCLLLDDGENRILNLNDINQLKRNIICLFFIFYYLIINLI